MTSSKCWVRIVDVTDLTGEHLDRPDCVPLRALKASPDEGKFAIVSEHSR